MNKAFKVIIILAVCLFSVLAGFFFLFQKHPKFNYEAAVHYGAESQPSQSEKKLQEEPIKMLFFGDAMLDRGVGLKIKQKGLSYFFEKLAVTDLFQGKDIVSCNLEGAVTDSGAHYAPSNLYDFAFSPQIVARFKDYNFNFFNLANNHLADQGDRGVLETRLNLDALGFNYSGCPDGQIGECSYVILQIKEKKIAFVGLSMVYSLLDQKKVQAIIKKVVDQADLALVNVHWGSEYIHYYSETQQQTAHLLVDSGADIIIGHHPHVVQGIEIYKGAVIFYSLGNFIFDQYFSVDTQQGLAVQVDFSSERAEFFLIPLELKFGQVLLMDNSEREDFLGKLAGWSNFDSTPILAQEIRAGSFVLEK